MWWIGPCTSRKRSFCSESQMDIDEILKAKLATIMEEPDMCEEMGNVMTEHCAFAKKRTEKIYMKVKLGTFERLISSALGALMCFL